jgi:hypothetical protein
MKKLIFFIIGLVILLYLGYRYFELDKNAAFQKSIQQKDLKAAEEVVMKAVSVKLADQTKKYLAEHNTYFISASNNICLNIKSTFDNLKSGESKVECIAHDHTFTARIKMLKGGYYCADASGFYTLSPTDPDKYESGVKCK